MTKDIIQKQTNKTLTMSDWHVLRDQASILIRSGFMPQGIRTPEQAIAIILAGQELGIGSMEAIRSIHVIQGKPTISPQLMLALARRTGQLADFKIETHPDKVRVMLKRKGQSEYWQEFGDIEAMNMGLLGKDNYKKQKHTMMTWRAISQAMRYVFPDVLLGMYQPEELGAEVTVSEDDALEIKEVKDPEGVVSVEEVKETKEKIEAIADKHNIIDEIKARLYDLNEGDKDRMEIHLKELTEYTSKKSGEVKWLTMDSLEQVYEKRPQWITHLLHKLEKEQPLNK